MDGRSIGDVYDFGWQDGSDEASRSRAGRSDHRQGRRGRRTWRRRLVHRAEHRQPAAGLRRARDLRRAPFYPILGAAISKATFDSLYQRPRNQYAMINVQGEPSPADKASSRVASGFPDANVQTRRSGSTSRTRSSTLPLLLYVLLALSVIVSLFGMVNTLVLSVFERTREIGMLRAVGMTRRQIRRMIRHESVITALIGAALGLPLGIFLAALVTRALSQFDISFVVPLRQRDLRDRRSHRRRDRRDRPARRAARLRVLEALQYE